MKKRPTSYPSHHPLAQAPLVLSTKKDVLADENSGYNKLRRRHQLGQRYIQNGKVVDPDRAPFFQVCLLFWVLLIVVVSLCGWAGVGPFKSDQFAPSQEIHNTTEDT